jgi:hypothetical protein
MKIGDYIISKCDHTFKIKCGDGLIGEYSIISEDKFIIKDINFSELSIKLGDHIVWFLINESDDYFLEWYQKYFYGITEYRCEKINKINKINKID